MFGTNMKHLLSAAIILLLASFAGCIMNPVDDKVPPAKPTFVYLDLTHREDAIKNLVTAYKQHNIDEFSKLLLLQPPYFWRNQDIDIRNHHLPEFVERSTDIQMTTNLFNAADKRPPATTFIDKLELTIEDGAFTPLDSIQGTPCDDCWETTRVYFINVVISGGDVTYYGNDLVKFAIVPEMDHGKKLYKIGRMDDIQMTPP